MAAPVADLDYWCFDPMLVDAALAGRLQIGQLDQPDRCYLVAELTARGESGEQIAERLRCSRRLICHLRVDALTLVLLRLFAAEREREHARHALDTAAAAHKADIARLEAQAAHLRARNGELVDQLAAARRA
jgi:hypothetical protein